MMKVFTGDIQASFQDMGNIEGQKTVYVWFHKRGNSANDDQTMTRFFQPASLYVHRLLTGGFSIHYHGSAAEAVTELSEELLKGVASND